MDILLKRRKVIDDIVADLLADYDCTNFEDLKKASEDRNITLIKNNRVIIPSTYYHHTRKRWFILMRNSFSKNIERSILAHEIGHAVLDHRPENLYKQDISREQSELEAYYFQERLGYPKYSFFKDFPDIFFMLATKPLISTRYVYSQSFERYYDRELILSNDSDRV